MREIVLEYELECQRFRAGNSKRPRPGSVWHGFGGCQQLPVECLPQVDQFSPVAALISMQSYPSTLLIAGHGRVIFQLRANDPLMIVGGGIEQVPEFLLRRPASWRRLASSR